MGDSAKNLVAFAEFEKSTSQLRILGNIGNSSYTHYTYAGNRDGSDWFVLFYLVSYDAGKGNAYVTIKADHKDNWEIVGFRMGLEKSTQ